MLFTKSRLAASDPLPLKSEGESLGTLASLTCANDITKCVAVIISARSV